MEVGLITLGGLLIIASFEIQFRYLDTAKKYYDNVLEKITEKLDDFLKEKKPLVEKNELKYAILSLIKPVKSTGIQIP